MGINENAHKEVEDNIVEIIEENKDAEQIV